MEISVNGKTLRLVEGDITELAADAIVNAANKYLQLGSGVAGAIRVKGGPVIQRECDELRFCPEGGAVITHGGNLKAGYVIHAVGPLGSDPEADAKLISAVHTSLAVAEDNGLASMALPAISTGVFGFPIARCARLTLETVRGYLASSSGSLNMVILCLYGQAAYAVFSDELKRQTT